MFNGIARFFCRRIDERDLVSAPVSNLVPWWMQLAYVDYACLEHVYFIFPVNCMVRWWKVFQYWWYTSPKYRDQEAIKIVNRRLIERNKKLQDELIEWHKFSNRVNAKLDLEALDKEAVEAWYMLYGDEGLNHIANTIAVFAKPFELPDIESE